MLGQVKKYDGADLSDVQLPGGLTMPVVFFFKYLGDIISSDGTDVRAVEARLTDALLVLGSYTRTDTNDLAGGARRGKGAMVTSHTSFVLKRDRQGGGGLPSGCVPQGLGLVRWLCAHEQGVHMSRPWP